MIYHPAVQKIKKLLDSRGISYEFFEHEPVRTSEEAAKVRPGYGLKQGAKALIVKLYLRNGLESFVMLVVPGDLKLDIKKVKSHFDAKDLRFATVDEVGELTDGVLVGGIPPLGSIFNLRTCMDPKVAQSESIVFNAGDRSASIAIKASDYILVENPEGVDIT